MGVGQTHYTCLMVCMRIGWSVVADQGFLKLGDGRVGSGGGV